MGAVLLMGSPAGALRLPAMNGEPGECKAPAQCISSSVRPGTGPEKQAGAWQEEVMDMWGGQLQGDSGDRGDYISFLQTPGSVGEGAAPQGVWPGQQRPREGRGHERILE